MRNNPENPNSLQILHHGEVFETRKLALQYITDFYKPNSLDAEPFVVKYGDARNPSVILAFGTSSEAPGSVFALDIAEVNEKIDEIISSQGEYSNVNEAIENIVAATGLTFDDNKIKDKISYEPDAGDAVIGRSTSVADAVDRLSKYAQENASGAGFTPGSSSSAQLAFEETGTSKTLIPTVKISEHGKDDDLEFNNNIIGVKSDGIYAASHLSYDEEGNRLVFTTSGYKNGEFKDDAVVQTVNLGKHTAIEGGRTDTLDTNVTLRDNMAQVTGDVRLGSGNSIVVRDGGLEANVSIDVDMATNKLLFTVGNNTVVKQLPGVELFQNAEYNDENEEIIITFKTGNTLVIPVHGLIHTWNVLNSSDSAVELVKNVVTGGVDTLSGDIRLRSTDNLIGKENGMLYVSDSLVQSKVDEESARAVSAEAELMHHIGEIESSVRPVGVENTQGSPIILSKRSTDEGDVISAGLSILDNDHNLLRNDNGALFADADANSHVALWGNEVTNVQSAINTLRDGFNDIQNIKDDIAELKEDNLNIKDAIADYQEDLDEQKQRITANEGNIAQLMARQTALEGSVTNLTTLVNTFDGRITQADSKAQQAMDAIDAIGGLSSITERIDRIEEILGQLIDFGEYDIQI